MSPQISEIVQPAISPIASPKALIRQADHAITAGRPDRALVFFERALLFEPDNVDLLLRIAALHADEGRPGHPREYIAEGLRHEENAGARNFLGYIEAREGLIELAAAQFEGVIVLDPDNQYALLHLGISYQQLGRAHEAAKALEATTALNPKDQGEGAEYLYHYLCLAYIDTEDYDNALAAFGKAAVLSPYSPDVPRRIGQIQELRGDRAAAQATYKRAYLLDPAEAGTREKVETLAQLAREGDPAPKRSRPSPHARRRRDSGRPTFSRMM